MGRGSRSGGLRRPSGRWFFNPSTSGAVNRDRRNKDRRAHPGQLLASGTRSMLLRKAGPEITLARGAKLTFDASDIGVLFGDLTFRGLRRQRDGRARWSRRNERCRRCRNERQGRSGCPGCRQRLHGGRELPPVLRSTSRTRVRPVRGSERLRSGRSLLPVRRLPHRSLRSRGVRHALRSRRHRAAR